MVLTPEGRVSQYYYGVEYPPKDLAAGIDPGFESARSARSWMKCFCIAITMIRPPGNMARVISRILKLSGLATILLLGGMVLILFRRGPHSKGKEQRGSHRYV